MKTAIEHVFTGATTPYTSYDVSKTVLGADIVQHATEGWAGPRPITIGRPCEESTVIPGYYPHTITISDTEEWIFLCDGATAAANRRFILYVYNKITGNLTWNGYITLTTFTSGNITITSFRSDRQLYTTGTVTVSGTTVTGSATAWQSAGMCVGNRIGFGSTNPTLITSWYYITNIASDGTLTIDNDETYATPTAYVIEDLRLIILASSSVTTSSGIYVVKGLRKELFTTTGTNIAMATTSDNIQGTYFLKEQASPAFGTCAGLGLGPMTDWTTQYVYAISRPSTSSAKILVYNVRQPLTSLSSGGSVEAIMFVTGVQTLVATISVTNNGRYGSLTHTSTPNDPSLFFVSTTRIYRAPISAITNGSTTFVTETMTEIPPGGTTTSIASATMGSIEISNSIDRLIIPSTTTRTYVTQFNTIGDPMDHVFLADIKMMNQSSSDSRAPIVPSPNAAQMSIYVNNGMAYASRLGTTAAINQLFIFPLGVHWTYAENTIKQTLVTPEMPTPYAAKLYRIYVNAGRYVGEPPFMVPAEPYRVFFRTAGISDNTGAWTQIDQSGNMSSYSPGTSIQFKFEFSMLAVLGVPNKIYSIAMVYETYGTDSHYTPSVANSSITNRIFAFRQEMLWGSNIPTLRMRIYNAETNVLILDDTTVSSASGIWEYSTNTVDWNTWSVTADLLGNYIRYTATSLPNGIYARALLTQV